MEVLIFPLKTSLTAAITTTTRPVTFAVAATNSALGAVGAVFSALIYDAGTDTNPTNAEAIQITSGGGTLSWTGTTETGSVALTHASGSTVLATVFTPRSVSQPLADHVTLATTPDPHTGYMRKGSFFAKGDLLIGTGLGTFSTLPIPISDGVPLVSATTMPLGVQWGSGGGVPATTQVAAAALSALASLVAIPGGAQLVANASLSTTTAGTVGAASTQIATLVADGLTSITFPGIGTYKNLRLTGSAKSNRNALLDTLTLRANGDQNKDYTTQGLTVAGALATASVVDSLATSMSVADVPGILAAMEIPVTVSIEIPNPSSQSYAKGIIARSVAVTTGGGAVELVFRAGVWSPSQPTPITSLTLALSVGSFAIGSTFTLWGDA